MSYWIQYPNLDINEQYHKYYWMGAPVKNSVTGVLSNVGTRKVVNGTEKWAPVGFDSRWVNSDTAVQFGSTFHKIGEIIMHGGIASFPEIMTPWVEQFKRFKSEWQVEPLLIESNLSFAIEYPVYSEQYRVAGAFDCLARVVLPRKKTSVLAMLDWKSSSSSQRHHRAQVAAYIKFAKEVLGIKEKVIGVPVRFDSDNYYPDVRDNCPEDWNWFLSCLNVLNMAN